MTRRAPTPASHLVLVLVLAAALSVPASAAVPAPPVDPFLAQYAATYRFRLGRPADVRVTPDGATVLFLRSGPRSFERDLYAFDVATGRERVLLTAAQVLAGAEERLTAEEKARRERMRLAARGIATYGLSDDGARILVPLSGRLFVVERASGAVRELPVGAGGAPLDPRFSPDGARVAFVRDGDLYGVDVASGAERRLTATATETLSNGLAEFVAQEEMGRYEGYWWAPDGRRIVFQETDTAPVERLWIADPAAPEAAPQPWPYPRAGRANARVRLGIVPVGGAADGGAPTWIAWDAERYPYLAAVRWSEGAPLTLLVQDRTQTEEALLTVDPATGETAVLHVERDPTWLNLDPGVPRWLPAGEAFLWSTERDGGWALELRGKDGRLLRTVVPKDWGYQALLGVDAERGVVHVLASADPTQAHVLRAPLGAGAGEGPVRLTTEPGVHAAVFPEVGGAAVWVHTVERPDGPIDTVVRRGDGAVVGTLRSVAEAPPFAPRLEILRVEAGGRAFHASVVRPRTPAAGPLPCLLYVYGGPHANVVQAAGQRYLLHQWLADRGFLVVAIDGRGTPGRGRDWERALAFAAGPDGPRGDITSVPLADQVAALEALAARVPELDLTRVGVYGWSYGGTMAAQAALQRPDRFRAAAAVAPVADWRDYDTHYTERYLGLPDANPEGYARSSPVTFAAEAAATRAGAPLLVLHGTADDNVYFFHSLALVDALFRAGRRFEFVPLVGFTHSVPDPVMTTRIYGRLVSWFEAHLGADAPGDRPVPGR